MSETLDGATQAERYEARIAELEADVSDLTGRRCLACDGMAARVEALTRQNEALRQTAAEVPKLLAALRASREYAEQIISGET